MSPLRIEEQQAEWHTIEQLMQTGPVVVMRNGVPLLIVQEATAEWMEALQVETEQEHAMPIEEYARLHDLLIDEQAYREEFPTDTPYTYPA